MSTLQHASAWRRPVNIARAAQGTIHHDETAQSVGLRGGAVAGSVHMEQFAPLLIELFGPEWRATGGLSLFFLQPTMDGEPVRCCAGPVQAAGALRRCEVWMESDAGARVMEGSAHVGGCDPESALKQRLRQVRPAREVRILAAARVGAKVRDVATRIDAARLAEYVAGRDDPAYTSLGRSTDGRAVAPANLVVDAFRAVEKTLVPINDEFVGLYGAIEIEHLAGPVLADTDYRVSGCILALGESPKTEMIWYEAELREESRPVARLLHMSRLLKASSPLWAHGSAALP
jgi:hypothetical protein